MVFVGLLHWNMILLLLLLLSKLSEISMSFILIHKIHLPTCYANATSFPGVELEGENRTSEESCPYEEKRVF